MEKMMSQWLFLLRQGLQHRDRDGQIVTPTIYQTR